MAILIKTNGQILTVTPANGTSFTNDEVRPLVTGSEYGTLDIFDLEDGTKPVLTIWCDDDGLNNEAEPNPKAAQILKHYSQPSLVGNVLIEGNVQPILLELGIE